MSKKTYEALSGVDWVNGARVPEDRKVKLTAAEAMYDLGLDRIKLVEDEPPAQPAQPAPAVVTDAKLRR